MQERKNIQLWQAYQWWYELSEMEKRHTLRISSAEREVSQFSIEFEQEMIEKMLYERVPKLRGEGFKLVSKADIAKEAMLDFARKIPCFEWATSVKGLEAGSQVAKVLALIDDIAKFDNVSKLWRYAGYGLYDYWLDAKGKVVAPKAGWVQNGEEREWQIVTPKPEWTLQKHADVKTKGFVSPFNTELKSTVYIVVDMFIKHKPEPYRSYYDEVKEEYHKQHSKETINGKVTYSDAHINKMAIRKVAKLWLQHLWLVWRTMEDLPVSMPYIHTVGGHTNYIAPPNFEM